MSESNAEAPGPGLSAFGWASLWDTGHHGNPARHFDEFSEDDRRKWFVFAENANAMLADAEKRVEHLNGRVAHLEYERNIAQTERDNWQNTARQEVVNRDYWRERAQRAERGLKEPDAEPVLDISEPLAGGYPRAMVVRWAASNRIIGNLWQLREDSFWLPDPPLQYELICEGWSSKGGDWRDAQAAMESWAQRSGQAALQYRNRGEEALPPVDSELVCDAIDALKQRIAERIKADTPEGAPTKEHSDEAQTIGWVMGLLPRIPRGGDRRQVLKLLDELGQHPTRLVTEAKP